MKEDKTVIVLGAGFSYGAGIPMQDQLLESVNLFYASHGTVEEKNRWKSFSSFFEKNMGFDFSYSKIEDIFTILDKTLLDDDAFRGASNDEVRNASNNLLNSVKSCIADISKTNFENRTKEYIKYYNFAKTLIEERTNSAENDNISIVCLNWDDYFERMLTYVQRSVPEWNDTLLDYCTYDYSFSNSGKSMPSITKKAKGKVNFKILKPHGSVNWGYCPNCGRLYISLGNKIRTKYECIKYCNKKYKSIRLHPLLLTPTFLKDIENTHIKGIWQNMGIELNEATKIIFIGYSLRPEDFLFRYHLLKFTDKDTKIYVFDYTKEKEPFKKHIIEKEIQQKYDYFFQTIEPVQVFLDGWENNTDQITRIIKSEI